MEVEYEATFTNIDKDEIRERLKNIGAELVYPEVLQTRVIYDLPKGNEIEGGWMRIRNEADKITLSLKICVRTDKIEDQKEICLEIDSFEKAEVLLQSMGCKKKAYQETKRELWKIHDVEVCIDEWPFLEPFVEIEGDTEDKVRAVSENLGFDYNKAKFCSIDYLYSDKYGLPIEVFNDKIPKIVFDMENPFI